MRGDICDEILQIVTGESLFLWRKKARTVITVLAVVLSSSLLTSVVNFAASGNTMLKSFLGEGYDAYQGAYTMILFVTMSGLKEIADGISDYISYDYGYTVMADYTSNYENRINPETGRRESHYVQPIDNVLAEKITEELEAYEGGEIFGMGQDYNTYVTVLGEQEITPELREMLQEQREQKPTQDQPEQDTEYPPAGERPAYELEVYRHCASVLFPVWFRLPAGTDRHSQRDQHGNLSYQNAG